ncbi:MAG: hypothetical protein OXH29_10030 [bacterium]|nr:hypothetical protein [bacterium]
MSTSTNTRAKIVTFAAALALVVTACSGGDDSPATAPIEAPASTEVPAPTEAPATQAPAPEPTTEGAAPAPTSDLPSVDLIDVSTGDIVNLASFAPSDRHLVLWFWAPH